MVNLFFVTIRVRTAVNLYSHCFCTVITYELSKKNIDTLGIENLSSGESDQVPLNHIELGTIQVNASNRNNEHQKTDLNNNHLNLNL
jgi:hypothetical protein